MSFIDYNFFPILFFLGWNILTTKQFRFNTYGRSDSKILSALSVFSLTDLTNQSLVQSHSKHQETNNILKFVPEFRFLSENQKSIHRFIPQTVDQSVFKNPFFKHRILTPSSQKVTAMQAKIKAVNELKNEKNLGWFVNNNRVNALEKATLNLFYFTYRSKRKRFFSSFFPHNRKIQPLFDSIKPSLNVLSVFSKNENTNGLKFCPHNEFENIFFGGLCSSQNHSSASLWKKIGACGAAQKLYYYNWFLNRITGPQTTNFLNRPAGGDWFCIKNQTKKAPNLKASHVIINESIPEQRIIYDYNRQETERPRTRLKKKDFIIMFQNSMVSTQAPLKINTKKFNRINSIHKQRSTIRLLLRSNSQNVYSLNPFQIALGSSHRTLFSCFTLGQDQCLDSLWLAPIPSRRSDKKDTHNPKKPSEIDFSSASVLRPSHTKNTDPSRFLAQLQTSPNLTPHALLYGGSWYYENLLPEYRLFNDKTRTLQFSQSEPVFILNSWYRRVRSRTNSFKQKHITNQAKRLKSKQFAIAWLYNHRYDLLWCTGSRTNFLDWPYQQSRYSNQVFSRDFRPHDCTINPFHNAYFSSWGSTVLGDFAPVDKYQTRLKNESELNSMTQPYSGFKNFAFSPKLCTRRESDIGIYFLAHKLSSVGFGNGNSEIDIYPFKYNDSYRYNFQNMNISNQRFKYFLGLSDLGSSSGFRLEARSKVDQQTQDISRWTGNGLANSNIEQNNMSSKPSHSSNLARLRPHRKFLDFQNPIFSKIYAPVYQPQGLNLLSFLTNSFLKVIPNSTINSSYKQIQPLTHDYSHFLANYKKINRSSKTTPINFQETSSQKELKMLNNFHHKLPINGIHVNPYPWITQNADKRWSDSNSLWNFLGPSNLLDGRITSSAFWRGSFRAAGIKPNHFSFSNSENGNASQFLTQLQASPNKNDNANNLFFKRSPSEGSPSGGLKNTNVSQSLTNAQERFLKKEPLKNTNSTWYFKEKPSCIKKPSIFFSSFRHLPYFFISETLSRKGVTFPQANLDKFFSINKPGSQCDKPTTHNDIGLSISYNLFQNGALKENQKKKVIKPWKGYLQHKSYNLKPLSTFIKKEVGHQTSLFSPPNGVWVSKQYSKTNKNIKQNLFVSKKTSIPNDTLFFRLDWSRAKKHTWTIFPPLFQPLTFRFIDLNLPRTWSSELFTEHVLSPLEQNTLANQTEPHLGFFQKQRETRPLLNWSKESAWPNQSLQTKKWNGTQKNSFYSSLPFYFSDFFRFSPSFINQVSPDRVTRTYVNDFDRQMINSAAPHAPENQSPTKVNLSNSDFKNDQNRFFESTFPLTDIIQIDKSKQPSQKSAGRFFKKKRRLFLKKIPKSARMEPRKNSKIIVYGEKPLLKTKTLHGPPLKNQKESISLPSYLKNITNQNYQNLCPNNLNELYFVFWILFNKALFIYLSLHYLRKFILFLGTDYIGNLFQIFVTMKFIDGNILSIIKTFHDFNFQLNQQNVIDIKVNKQLKNIKRN